MSVTGVVAALEFEARCLEPRPWRSTELARLSDRSLLSISGIGAENAVRAARTLIAAGAGALLSWGVAGGLDPALDCGTVVLPDAVVRQGTATDAPLQRFETHFGWRARLATALAGQVRVVTQVLLSSATPLASAALKASAFHQTRAVAVDMESAALAALAADHGLPFLALRVILDTAHDSLPHSLMRALAPAAQQRLGLRRVWPLLGPLLSSPADWGPLLRLAAQYRIARRSLCACARLGRPTQVADPMALG